ncbi:MAG TPA: hypothetical protein VFC24_14665 [Casimicrobiaceae bacterium]|nr:hypothetical protein [Casimicrobiaceae bacterium]
MGKLRQLVRRLSFPLVALLLFSQIATAAYACPQVTEHAPMAAHPVAMMDHCHGDMDVAQPNLCKSHHDSYAQATSNPISVDLPAVVAAALIVVPTATLRPHAFAPWMLHVVRPPGAPPLYLLHSNLRN